MKHWKLIRIVVAGVAILIPVLVYVGISFPILRRWGGHMLDPEFLIMLYRLCIVVIIVIGFSKLKVPVDWWLKNKEKELEHFREQYNELLSGHVDSHLKRADRHLKEYRESYEKRLNDLEGKCM